MRSPTSGSTATRTRLGDGLHRPERVERPLPVGTIPDDELLEAVDESYRLVVSRLPAKVRPEGWDD